MLTDIRYSVRSLARNLGFAFALLVSIALGLGANVTVLCFIRGLGARSSPVSPDSRLVSLFAPDRYRSVIATVASVTPEVAALFHLSLEDGVLLGHRFWQNELGKSALEGKHLLAAGTAANLAGIAPESLDGVYDGRQVDVWRLLRDEPPDRTLRNLWPIARLRSETSVTALAASGKVIVVPYTGMTPDMSKAIGGMGVLLRFATVLVFFVACVNVTSFLLGRAASRSHANSIRVTLGVSRSRLVLSVLTDSIVVATAGGVIGALLALWTSKVIPALLFERDAGFLILSPSISTIMPPQCPASRSSFSAGYFRFSRFATTRRPSFSAAKPQVHPGPPTPYVPSSLSLRPPAAACSSLAPVFSTQVFERLYTPRSEPAIPIRSSQS